MRSHQHCNSEDSGPQNQGFEEMKLKITQPKIQTDNKISMIDGNDLFENGRPTDYLPRSMYLSLPLKQIPFYVQENMTKVEMVSAPTNHNILKEKKYYSLQNKYHMNNEFKLVYSKFKAVNENNFMNSDLSLQEVMDFNPNNFKTFVDNNPPQEKFIFDSNFECGNLLYAYQLSNSNVYDLILQNDTNTNGYNQWFYFSFQNKQIGKVQFNIVNFVKKRTLFTYNIKPVILSQKSKQKDGIGWTTSDGDVSYYKNSIKRQNGKSYYTLSFEYSFKEKNDKVFFAMNLPYSYTRLIALLNQLQKKKHESILIQRNILCYTISNNALPILSLRTLTSKIQVVIMARQHPGETVGSHLLQRILLSITQDPQILNLIQFIIIPMVNPDGVIYGNFRTNLGGFDLNRQWQNPDKNFHPQIFNIKKLICKLPSVKLILDLHGHSKKLNSFLYCNNKEDQIEEKIFSCLLNRCHVFNLKDCSYGLTPEKMKTARGTLKNLRFQDIYTLETSFFGYQKENSSIRFSSQDFDKFSKVILSSIQIYVTNPNHPEIQNSKSMIKNNLLNFALWQKQKKPEDDSDSNPSQDEFNQLQRSEKVFCIKPIIQKRKNQNKRRLIKLSNTQKSSKTPIIDHQISTFSVSPEKLARFKRETKKFETSNSVPRNIVIHTKTYQPEINNKGPSFQNKKEKISSFIKPISSRRQITRKLKGKSEQQQSQSFDELIVPVPSVTLSNTDQPSRLSKTKLFIQYQRKQFKQSRERNRIEKETVRPSIKKLDLLINPNPKHPQHNLQKVQVQTKMINELVSPVKIRKNKITQNYSKDKIFKEGLSTHLFNIEKEIEKELRSKKDTIKMRAPIFEYSRFI